MTACPAKASDAVVAVAAADESHRRLASYSSPAPGGVVVPADPIPTEWVDEQGRVPILIPAEWADPEGNVVSFVTRDGRDYTSAMKALSDLAAENPEWLVGSARRPGSDPGALRSGGSGGQPPRRFGGSGRATRRAS